MQYSYILRRLPFLPNNLITGLVPNEPRVEVWRYFRQEKMKLLEDWIDDLNQQNRTLVDTVKELESGEITITYAQLGEGQMGHVPPPPSVLPPQHPTLRPVTPLIRHFPPHPLPGMQIWRSHDAVWRPSNGSQLKNWRPLQA